VILVAMQFAPQIMVPVFAITVALAGWLEFESMFPRR
jgi:hypothetical protein